MTVFPKDFSELPSLIEQRTHAHIPGIRLFPDLFFFGSGELDGDPVAGSGFGPFGFRTGREATYLDIEVLCRFGLHADEGQPLVMIHSPLQIQNLSPVPFRAMMQGLELFGQSGPRDLSRKIIRSQIAEGHHVV